jgi:hypothetical protein
MAEAINETKVRERSQRVGVTANPPRPYGSEAAPQTGEAYLAV